MRSSNLSKNLIEHHLDVVAGVPVTVVVKAAGFLEHAMQLDAARPHILDVSLGRFVTVCEAAFLLRLAPKHLVIAVRVERRVDVDQIEARLGQLTQLIEIIAAINDSRIPRAPKLWGILPFN